MASEAGRPTGAVVRQRRIAVVANEMEGTATGVGRYLRGLLSGIAELDRDWRWVLLFKGGRFEDPLWQDGRFEPVWCRDGGRAVTWEQFRLPRRLAKLGADLMFSPAYSLPLASRVPGVVTVHDMSFEVLPEEFRWRERWRRRLLARLSCRKAARVLVDMLPMRQQLSELYNVPDARIGVVPLAVDPIFVAHAPEEETPLADLGVRPPYVLWVGTIFPRRRPRLVLETFAAVREEFPELQLVMVGANRLPHPDRLDQWIEELGLDGAVLRPGWVEEDRLPTLYRRAELSVYLSTYEGYGLPPLESLACGTAALVGPGLGLDTLWPDYPFRCARLERAEVLPMMRRLLAEPDRTREVVAEAADILAAVTWRSCADRFVEELEEVLRS